MHALAVAIVIGLGLTSKAVAPDLWKDTAAQFSTAGGFLTLYGVVFTMIEAWRAKSAAKAAAEAARTASAAVSSMYALRDAAECQSNIRGAIDELQREGRVSTLVLAKIIELYIAEFRVQYAEPDSEHRLAVAFLESHSTPNSTPLKSGAMQRLNETLMKMLAHVSAAASAKIAETP